MTTQSPLSVLSVAPHRTPPKPTLQQPRPSKHTHKKNTHTHTTQRNMEKPQPHHEDNAALLSNCCPINLLLTYGAIGSNLFWVGVHAIKKKHNTTMLLSCQSIGSNQFMNAFHSFNAVVFNCLTLIQSIFMVPIEKSECETNCCKKNQKKKKPNTTTRRRGRQQPQHGNEFNQLYSPLDIHLFSMMEDCTSALTRLLAHFERVFKRKTFSQSS